MNVKKLALEAINQILNKNGFSNIVINEFFAKYEFTQDEKNLFTRLVLGTVEQKITLSFYLEPYLKKKPKPWLYNLLLMSLYQIIYMRIPNHAIVNEAVEIALLKDQRLASFVNGTLRNFLRNDLRSMDNLSELEKLSIKYSYPEWLVAYLLKDYKASEVMQIFAEFAEPKKMMIRVNTLKTSNEEVEKVFNNENIGYKKAAFLKNGYTLDTNILSHPLFVEGKITVQDLASQKVSEVLNPHPASTILDLCSAPGGKSSHLASMVQNEAIIYACDIYPHKLKLMERNFKKLGVNCVKTQLVDAREVYKYVKEQSFDYVLADLPCSGLGVLGHKVDLKYHMSIEAIEEIISLQKEILEANYNLVKPGGYLLISTCTLNKLENEEQVRSFIHHHPDYEIVTEETFLPYMLHTDGFYLCKLRRK